MSQGYQQFVVASNDTDVVVLFLYHIHFLKINELKQLWILYGTGDKKLYLPIHYLAERLGEKQCSVILKAHILTRSDYTSKIGTKAGALRCSPDKYITNFGEENMTSYDMNYAEKYLVKVYKSASKAETFNELRTEQYVEKSSSLLTLAPTSSAIYGHLKRCLYVVRLHMSLLHDFNEDPQHFGWTKDGGLLLPEKC